MDTDLKKLDKHLFCQIAIPIRNYRHYMQRTTNSWPLYCSTQLQATVHQQNFRPEQHLSLRPAGIMFYLCPAQWTQGYHNDCTAKRTVHRSSPKCLLQ